MTSKNSEYRYIFGPVPSRRLGLSLGVDLLPAKTCSLDCVYCESGATTHLTTRRESYVPLEEVQAELVEILSAGPSIDAVTFSGSGEPTLHSGIGDILRFLKTRYPARRIALLSNGTLFNRSDVRKSVLAADVIKVSLDAGCTRDFRRINRPHPDLSYESLLEGLVALRRDYSKTLWLETFLVAGINDRPRALAELRERIARIKPDRVHLNTLDRPGTLSWVKAVDENGLKRAADVIDCAAITAPAGGRGQFFKGEVSQNGWLLAMLKRRPCTADDIARVLGIDTNRTDAMLNGLVQAGRIQRQEMPRGIFYRVRS